MPNKLDRFVYTLSMFTFFLSGDIGGRVLNAREGRRHRRSSYAGIRKAVAVHFFGMVDIAKLDNNGRGQKVAQAL